MKQKGTRDRFHAIANEANLRVAGEGAEDCAEQRLAVHRRAEVAHVLSEYVVEPIEQFRRAPLNGESALLAFANLIPHLRVEALPQLLAGFRQWQAHVDLARHRRL